MLIFADNYDHDNSNEYEEPASAEEDTDWAAIMIGLMVGAFVLLMVISLLIVVCCCICNGTDFMTNQNYGRRRRRTANHSNNGGVIYPATVYSSSANQAVVVPNGGTLPQFNNGNFAHSSAVNPVMGQLPDYESAVKQSAPPAYESVAEATDKNESPPVGYSNAAYGEINEK